MSNKIYNFEEKEFNKISKLSENIYNTIIVVNYFCENQPEIEELNNLAPIIKNLKHDADILNAFFIDFENDNL